jgi:A/G-specific adenine glycosylase
MIAQFAPMNTPGPLILEWYAREGRKLPWRDTTDPYLIWIAEVVLQQTRIAQGISYYYRFIGRFPDVRSLAEAEMDEVLKYWEGLGYYSRARNLHAAAQSIVNEYGGEFPTHYKALMKLKGIGPYTARAIGSFAFGNATGVIDGNVLRVMSRVLGDASPVNQQRTRERFQEIIDQWVQGIDSRGFNHGIMDLGSVLCTPTKPGCMICPLEGICEARQQGTTHLLPVKEKKAARRIRFFFFYLIRNAEGDLLIRQRPPKGVWGGLWEIPNREVAPESWEERKQQQEGVFLFSGKHVFTHFDMQYAVFDLAEGLGPLRGDELYVSPEQRERYAFPRAVLNMLEEAQVR